MLELTYTHPIIAKLTPMTKNMKMQKDAGEYNIKRQNIPEKESVYN